MKKFIIPALFILTVLSASARAEIGDLYKSTKSNQSQSQDIKTATVKSASRLFKVREDITSVIIIIPAGSVVSVLGSDSTYYHVTFEENEGFILKKQAVIDKPIAAAQPVQPAPETQTSQDQSDSRYTALESKYGQAMAERLYSGKIWKGMSSGMVRDSWGAAAKVNRQVSGNTIKEEWIYRSTWLYFENDILLQWGPTKK